MPNISKPLLSDVFNFRSGCRNRKSYVLAFLAFTAGVFGVSLIATLLFPVSMTAFAAVQGIGFAVLYAMWMAVSTQRLRDIGWSDWWVVAFLVPAIAFIASFVLFFIPSTAHQTGSARAR